MPHNWWTRKNLVLIAAVVSLACVLAFVAVGLTFPQPVPNAALGPDWQCSRLSLVFTVCSRVKQAERAIVRVAGETACRRPRMQARLI